MFLGAAAVGKTSLRHGLMNERLPRKAESTILAETHRVKYLWAMTGNPIDHNWLKMTEDDEVAEEVRMIENASLSRVIPYQITRLCKFKFQNCTKLGTHVG